MSKYTTGELAKLCGVSVRTVQYYDFREILAPSQLSEGGRRLYSEEDLKRMRVICYLRELGMPINSIKQLLQEEDPGSVLMLLLDEQEKVLQQELQERQEKLQRVEQLKREIKGIEQFSVESIGDIAYAMENKKKLRKLHMTLLFTGIPLSALQWISIILWSIKGIWWLFAVYVLIIGPYAVWVSRFYFKRVAYICPRCHGVFKPAMKEAFWANHTPKARKLTCGECGHKGFCVETISET